MKAPGWVRRTLSAVVRSLLRADVVLVRVLPAEACWIGLAPAPRDIHGTPATFTEVSVTARMAMVQEFTVTALRCSLQDDWCLTGLTIAHTPAVSGQPMVSTETIPIGPYTLLVGQTIEATFTRQVVTPRALQGALPVLTLFGTRPGRTIYTTDANRQDAHPDWP